MSVKHWLTCDAVKESDENVKKDENVKSMQKKKTKTWNPCRKKDENVKSMQKYVKIHVKYMQKIMAKKTREIHAVTG